MNMHKTTLFAAIGAVSLSMASLGGSVWVSGCGSPMDAALTPASQTSPVRPASVLTAKRMTQDRLTSPALAATNPKPLPTVAAPEPGALQMNRLVVTTKVEKREPSEVEGFAADGTRIYAFMEAQNQASSEQAVVVTFENAKGDSVGHVKLNIPAKTPRWRTWAFTRQIREPGEWFAVIRSEGGEMLGRAVFQVKPKALKPTA